MIDWLHLDNLWSFLFLIILVLLSRVATTYYEQYAKGLVSVSSCPEETKVCDADTEEEKKDDDVCDTPPAPPSGAVYLQVSRGDLQSLLYHLDKLKKFAPDEECASSTTITVEKTDYDELKTDGVEVTTIAAREEEC